MPAATRVLFALTAPLAACGADRGSPPVEATGAGVSGEAAIDPARHALRESALASARVWLPPQVPVSSADLRTNPAGANGFRADAEVDCRFILRQVGGTTPKFYCELPNGEVVKVKYGRGIPSCTPRSPRRGC